MMIQPAIDLREGRCVRLHQGDFDQLTQYPAEPLALAAEYAAAGAPLLHVVDLDAAAGEGDNTDLIARLAASLDMPVQCGGGVRTTADVQSRLASGVQRVVVGSVAARTPALFGDWLQRFGGERLVAAVDVRGNGEAWRPALEGWRQQSERDLFDLLAELQQRGLRHLLCTDIDRDGTLEGPALDLYRDIRGRFPELRLQASGGIRSLDDLRELQALGCSGAVVGKALLEGRFSVTEALETLRS